MLSLNSKLYSPVALVKRHKHLSGCHIPSSPNKETLQQEIFPAQMVVKSCMIHLKIVHNKTVILLSISSITNLKSEPMNHHTHTCTVQPCMTLFSHSTDLLRICTSLCTVHPNTHDPILPHVQTFHVDLLPRI